MIEETQLWYLDGTTLKPIDPSWTISVMVNNLDDIGDVSVPSPTDGQVLTYNNTSGEWEASSVGGGDVSGPASSTDNAIVRFDGTGGKTIQNSGITIDDSDNISGINNLTGVDTNLVTGTAGTNGNLIQWNTDGDAVDSTIAATDVFTTSSDVDHDATTNFVANEHIDHSGVLITAGDGLTGGGDITTTRTIDIDINGTTDLASPAVGDEILLGDISNANAIRKSDIDTVLALYDSKTATLTNKDISNSNNTYRSASTTETGAVELATDAETDTGTDSTRAITPSNLDSVRGTTRGINSQTGTTYTLVLDDRGKLIELTNASSITLTVPPNSSVALPIGTKIAIAQGGAGTVSVAQGAGVTVKSQGSATDLNGQDAMATLVKVATDTWRLEGNLV